MSIAILDYGLGNLYSINQACFHVGIDAKITTNKDDIKNAEALILPGVGAFGDAMAYLNDKDLINSIRDFVLSGRQFLGICLGMQLMFSESEEFGNHPGLNFIRGKICRFPSIDDNLSKEKIPQIQWNQLIMSDENLWKNSALASLPDRSYVNFVHSYYAAPENSKVVLSYTEYAGIRYASSVKTRNITGFQFHPEKSGEVGLDIFRNWANSIKSQII